MNAFVLSEEPVSVLIGALNVIGIFVFAVSGALVAIRRQGDLFGVLVVAVVTSSAGGVLRDILIGQFPPTLVRETFALFLSIGAGLLTYVIYPVAQKLKNPIDFFDALGLGAFTVLGSSKALVYGINPVWAVALGVLTGVGGGVVRDMLFTEIPIILRREIYATAAIFGSCIFVFGTLLLPQYQDLWVLLGAVGCSVLRLLSLRKSWHLPKRTV